MISRQCSKKRITSLQKLCRYLKSLILSKCSKNLLLLLDGNFPQKLKEKPVTIEGNPVIGLKKSNQTLIRLSNYIKKYERFSRYRIKSMKGGFCLHLLVFPFVYHFRTIMIAQVESTFWNITKLFIFTTLQKSFKVNMLIVCFDFHFANLCFNIITFQGVSCI